MKKKVDIIILMIILIFIIIPAAGVAEKPVLRIESGGHKGTIKDVKYTPDGKNIISVSVIDILV